ncbi:MAG: hypothetical protein HYY98_02360 [Burkholderiales bacterium]|jgi:uncharacterized protein with HEPN domain|nr:hypothetical protein [Burkholderiales bacterium]
MSRARPLRVGDYSQHILEAIGSIQDHTAGMDLGIVWQTVQNDLPTLKAQVAALSL